MRQSVLRSEQEEERLKHTCSLFNLTLVPACRRYSSKMLARFHRCNFLKHPMTVPVRCLPRLHMTMTG